MNIRTVTARILAPIMIATGFRFTKNYRHGVTLWNRIVYRLVSTVEANCIADRRHA